MNERDEKDVAKQFAIEWLNRQGGDPLPDDYFTRVDVLFDDRVLGDEGEFDMLLVLGSDDDGGSARMFVQFEDEKIKWAAWYFDTTWGEMTPPKIEIKGYRDLYEGLHDDCEIDEPHTHPGGE